MKTYTAFLDMLILLFLILAIQFNLTDNYITDAATDRRGLLHIVVINWQTFLVIACFCVFLRYVAETVNKGKA